jgi:hypothetical protein
MLKKLLVPAGILFAGMVISSSLTVAKPAYAKKENKKCIDCHVKAGSKDLNDMGKYYGEHKSLEGYKAK